ncbi:hypothetical protein [Streptomyces sp. NBC_00347]|uniref:hypothetical protein n=1 Tax=Streptomyces sp. NBC_00347 TaxID=2975721 RepID=UPI00224DA511|nr:hypothetical protein [Streptomyces sp. NBC_00347]MCX5130472.1 hypothetical protein [Streptomyces sp. NBC_00347]
MTMHTARAHLDEPPDLAAIGIGVHGPAGHVDVFSLPHLWQLHLYGYEADLTVNGTEHAIRPGWVSLVPPGAEVRYRYRGRSPHLYVHLRLGSGGTPHHVAMVQRAGADLALLTVQLQQAPAAWPNTRILRQPSSAPRPASSNGRTCRLHGRPRGSAGVGTG